MAEFMIHDIQKVFGIGGYFIWDWLQKKIIVPTVKKAPGPGSPNIFSRKDMHRLGLYAELVEMGFKKEAAIRYAWGLNFEQVNSSLLRRYRILKIDGKLTRGILLLDLLRVQQHVDEVLDDYLEDKLKKYFAANDLEKRILTKFRTKTGFARKVGTDVASLSRILRNKRPIPRKFLPVWAKALECNTEELFVGR